MRTRTYALALLAFCLPGPARAGEDSAKLFFLGSWQIASAAVAPWTPAGTTPDPTESKSLVGKNMTFEATRIKGPGLLACPKLNYEVIDSTPEYLFQGAFDEMRRNDPKVDPAKLAAGLGFKPGPIKTLQTGCANELDFHFVDEKTAEFGLNNYVYTIKKQ